MGCCMTTPNAQGSQQQHVSANEAVSAQRPQPNPRDNHRGRRESQQNRSSGGGHRQSNRASQQNSAGLRITYLQNPTVEIINHTDTKGEGVQKTLAYDTPFSQSQLEAWRAEFWETRTSGSKQAWQLLKNACETDPETAAAIIEAAQLTLPQDSLTTAIDSAGVYYRVPICCIQMPQNFNIDKALDAMKAKKVPTAKNLNVKVRSPALGDHSVQCQNVASVEQLKNEYLSIVGAEKCAEKAVDLSKLRFFCMGKELKNDLFLYSYDVADGMVVQAMVKQTAN